LGVLVSGCASRRPGATPEKQTAVEPASTESTAAPRKSPKTKPPADPTAAKLSVTNENAVLTVTDATGGRVASVNPVLRFVVVDFILKKMPVIDQRLGVYRQGQKVGEVRITGPERGGNIVADLVVGEAQVGDEVRPE
jgi:hypothetical protein